MEEGSGNATNPENVFPKHKGKGKGVGKGQSNRHMKKSCSKDDTSKVKANTVNKQLSTQGSSIPKLKLNTDVINPVISSDLENTKLASTDMRNKDAQSQNISREDPFMADLVWKSVEPNEERIPRFAYI